MKGVHDGPNFLFRLRNGNAPDAIEIASKEARAQAVDEKREGLYFGMYGVPEKALLEAFLGVFEAGAKGGFEVVSGIHGGLRQVRHCILLPIRSGRHAAARSAAACRALSDDRCV